MGSQRIRKVKSRKELDEMVDDFVTQGYGIVSEGTHTVQLKKRSWGSVAGHILCLIIFGWWTLGLANLIYALVAHSGGEQVLVKITGKTQADEEAD